MTDTPRTPRRAVGRIGVTALALYLLAVAFRIDGCYAPDAGVRDDFTGGPAVGSPFPDFELRDVSGATIGLDDLAGGPAVIAFVPSLDWSAPTKARLIDLAEVFRERRDVRVAVVTTAAQTSPRALRFVQDRSTPFYYLVDEAGLTERLGLATEGPGETMAAAAATFVLDGTGTIRFRDTRERFDRWVDPERLLAAVDGTAG